jgi:hypothetical protein
MSRRIIALAAVAIAATVAVTTAAAHRSGVAVSGPFLGSYSATLTEAQASARGDDRLAGKFTLVLRRNGTYTVSNSFDGASHGKFEALSGKRLRFFHDSGCLGGGFERPQGGIYRWLLSGNGKLLTIRLVNEGPCSGRTDTLTFPVWKRR